MAMTMPERVKCCRCERSFPPGAVMLWEDNKTIPALVVPQEVGGAQEAVEQAVCQVCLERKGDPARGLKRVLAELGVREPSATIPVGRGRVAPMPNPAAVAGTGRRRMFAPPSLDNVTIVGPGGQRPERAASRPARISKPMPAAPAQQRGRAHGDSRRSRNEEALAVAAQAIAARQAAERQAELERRAREREQRRERFEAALPILRAMLGEIRERAPQEDVDELVDAFNARLRDTTADDLEQRGKTALMELVGTSVKELAALSHMAYLTMRVECYKLDDKVESRLVARTDSPIRVKHPRECSSVGVFVGGTRPESWGAKGRDALTGHYAVEVLRRRCALPDPNPTPTDSGPKIVYPQGKTFGGTYEIQGSSRGECPPFPWDEAPQAWAACALLAWLGDHQEAQIACNGTRVNMSASMALAIGDIVLDETEDEDAGIPSEGSDDPANKSELPAAT